MAESPVTAFQEELAPRLTALMEGVPVVREWAALRDEDGVYSPRLDVAVGPFALGTLVYVTQYDELIEKYKPFLALLYEYSSENLQTFGAAQVAPDFDHVVHRNPNARCFLAFEIENEVSRKHLMGGAINAAALGRVGIAVGWTQEKVRAFVKLRSYLLFLAAVGKNTFDPANLLILSKEQLRDAISAVTKTAA